MSLKMPDRLAAWLSAWKWVLLLAAGLAASVTLNLQQWKARAVAKSEARAETLEDMAQVTAGIAREAQADHRELVAGLTMVVERGRTERVVYRTAAAKKPLAAVCAPGQARMDAVNAGADR